MKRYHVYGVGNALVDMEFRVEPETLEQLRIEKGVMTLVDEAHQNEILSHLDGQMVKRGSGGSAANSVIAVAQLGGRGFYSCKVADDDIGHFYIKDLMDNGVDTNLHQEPRDAGVTGKCLVFVTPDADRTMTTYLGITGDLSSKELVPGAIADSEYLYMEGYLVTNPMAHAAAIEARQLAERSGTKTAISLSDPNMVQYFKGGLLEMIGDGVDLLFANESEALGMAETEQLDQAIDYLKGVAREFAITRGAEGAVVFDGNSLIEIAANPVTAVDTVGAGDMFAGAFLYGLTHGLGHAKAGALASLASARLVEHFGPRMPAEKTLALLAEI